MGGKVTTLNNIHRSTSAEKSRLISSIISKWMTVDIIDFQANIDLGLLKMGIVAL